MSPTVRPLYASAPATVPASGRVSITLQPLQAFVKWKITKITVSNTGSNLVPTARVYKGAQLVDATYTGTLDSSDTNIELQTGESLVCVWEGRVQNTAGADVGSVCVLTVQGEELYGV